MVLGRHGDDGEIDRPGGQRVVERVEDERGVANDTPAVTAGVHGAGERHPRGRLQDPRVVAAHHPEPDDDASRRPGCCGSFHDDG
jgi:hypothetical protein